jgi:hypothetical protein
MKKLSGGPRLDCGHAQQVSERRMALASQGHEQHSVWCIECDNWSRLTPVSVTEQEKEIDK